MSEWINPKYAHLVEQLRTAEPDRDRPAPPVRGFLVPEDTDND